MAAVISDNRTRRILVSNVPVKAKARKLVVYFQKSKYGGRGDVLSVTFPKSLSEQDQAVIEFESPDTLTSVLQQNHVFAGQQLCVTLFPEQAFGKTEVILSDETIAKLDVSGQREHLTDCTGVVFSSSHQRHHISGEWYQVKAAVELIEQMTSPKVNSGRTGGSTNEAAVARPGGSTNEDAVAPTEASSIGRNKESGASDSSKSSGAIPKAPMRRKSSSEELPSTEVTVDWNVFEYFKRCHPDTLRAIGKKHKVKFQVGGHKVIFTSSRASGVSGGKEAAKDFQHHFSKLNSEVRNVQFDLADLQSASKDEIQDAIALANKSERVFVGKSWKDGEENIVAFLALSKDEANSAAENFRSMFAPKKRVILREIAALGSPLKVSVRHGDYRKEKTVAILSEVDLFGKGRLLDECAPHIKDDVNAWLKVVKPEAWSNSVHATKADDRLCCKRIIHYYLKVQFHLDVEKALLMCFEYAHREDIPSVTIPVHLVGSGLKTSDLNLAIFEAIRSFVTTHQQSCPKLKEIHVVHRNLAEAKRLESALEPLSDVNTSSDSGASSVGRGSKSSTEDENQVDACPICLDDMTGAVSLKTLDCKHVFHQACIDRAFAVSKKCPMCMRFYGKPEGTQPTNATMTTRESSQKLPGYSCGTIIIEYQIPSGIQGPEHPNPGQKYYGASRKAYLPNTPEGKEILHLLRKAFDARLVFTIGRSVTTGRNNCVTWNDIHHKTNIHGGPTGLVQVKCVADVYLGATTHACAQSLHTSHSIPSIPFFRFGYPDPTYLSRLRIELADKGITRDTQV